MRHESVNAAVRHERLLRAHRTGDDRRRRGHLVAVVGVGVGVRLDETLGAKRVHAADERLAVGHRLLAADATLLMLLLLLLLLLLVISC